MGSARERQTLYIPVQSEERAGGGENGTARGQDCQPDQTVAAENQFGVSFGSDTHDAAAPANRCRDVKISRAIEGHSLRASQAAIEKTDFTVIIDAADAVVAGSGGPGNVEFSGGTERKMVCGNGRLERGENENLAVWTDLENS